MTQTGPVRREVAPQAVKWLICFIALCALSCVAFSALSFEADYDESDGLYLVLRIRNTSPLVYFENLSILLPGVPDRLEIPKVETGGIYVERVLVTEKKDRYDADVRYTFCEGDVCLYREEEVLIRPARFPDWLRYLGNGVFFFVLGVLVFWLWPRAKKAFTLAIILAALTGWLGIRQYQPETVRSIASTLCISCIGMEVVPDTFPITADYIDAVLELPITRVEVFHTDWCRSCPVVIEFLEELAMYCGNLEIIVYDAEEESRLAAEKGVYSGNTLVVPSTIVGGKTRITGAERFPERFLKSLREVK
ncbi:MAG TPA: thioredoxin family protein [Thermotogota bacterium]|nr:thioredoxin family protein [Thermotogota bacterium]HPH10694.1 thioredoxin family protein [Thermotogota bacterium]HPM20846.1 thioredoxin family protein [Thermotogota bacterium]